MSFFELSPEGIAAQVEGLNRAARILSDIADARVHLGQQVTRLENLAREIGPVPYEPVPAGGHIPGQIVEHEGERWQNISRTDNTSVPGTGWGWKKLGGETDA